MKQYEAPVMKVIVLVCEDVVTLSNDNDGTKPHSGDLFGPVA